MYNLTNTTSANNILELVIAINNSSNGYFINIVLLLSLYLILIISFVRFTDASFTSAFLTTNSIIAIVSLLLWAVMLLNNTIFIMIVLIWIFSIFIHIISNKN